MLSDYFKIEQMIFNEDHIEELKNNPYKIKELIKAIDLGSFSNISLNT